MSIAVVAPGKLFLLGEYAVLFGGVAVVMAVNRNVRVSLVPCNLDDQSTRHQLLENQAAEHRPGRYVIESPGTEFASINGAWRHDHIEWSNTGPEHALVIGLLDALCDQRIISRDTRPFKLTIDSSELFNRGVKMGLGSSAAVSNSVFRAVLEYVGLGDQADELHPLVHNMHRHFQQGRGSGADIAASWSGGLIRFQRVSDHLLPAVHSMSLPPNLHYRFLWLGKPASTNDALNVMGLFQRQNPIAFTRALSPLLHLATTGAEDLGSGRVAEFVRSAKSYCHILAEFGRIIGVDIVSNEHAKLRDLALLHGVAYKPSGAGGGDFGVAVSTNINNLDNFVEAAGAEGVMAVDLQAGLPCRRVPIT